MHGANNYPLQKEKSNLNIALSYLTDTRSYSHALEKNLGDIVDRIEPDFIFYQSRVIKHWAFGMSDICAETMVWVVRRGRDKACLVSTHVGRGRVYRKHI
jgi:hypothetical protein